MKSFANSQTSSIVTWVAKAAREYLCSFLSSTFGSFSFFASDAAFAFASSSAFAFASAAAFSAAVSPPPSLFCASAVFFSPAASSFGASTFGGGGSCASAGTTTSRSLSLRKGSLQSLKLVLCT